jgi:hypothetical protein
MKTLFTVGLAAMGSMLLFSAFVPGFALVALTTAMAKTTVQAHMAIR